MQSFFLSLCVSYYSLFCFISCFMFEVFQKKNNSNQASRLTHLICAFFIIIINTFSSLDIYFFLI
jgi:hypothetical protein